MVLLLPVMMMMMTKVTQYLSERMFVLIVKRDLCCYQMLPRVVKYKNIIYGRTDLNTGAFMRGDLVTVIIRVTEADECVIWKDAESWLMEYN